MLLSRIPVLVLIFAQSLAIPFTQSSTVQLSTVATRALTARFESAAPTLVLALGCCASVLASALVWLLLAWSQARAQVALLQHKLRVGAHQASLRAHELTLAYACHQLRWAIPCVE